MLDLLLEPVFRAICFPIGWPFIKLMTWGRYPTKGAWFAQRQESDWTAGIGLTVLAVIMMAVLKQFVFP
jgi:hypothetical protein